MIIDTDVHELMESKADLAPYLSDHWRHVVDTYFFDRSPIAPTSVWYPRSPTLDERHPQWRSREGGDPYTTRGTSLEQLRTDILGAGDDRVAILNGMFYPDAYPGYYQFAAALGAAYNDWQIEHWLEPEPRLYGSVHVATEDPQAAAREIDRVAEHPQVVQVVLPTVSWKHYGGPVHRPIFEAAARNDLVVAFHHSFVSEPALPTRNELEWDTLAAVQTGSAHLLNLLAGGLFDEFPQLKVVLLETGVSWLPWFMMRADEHYKEFRAEVPWMKRMPSEYIRSNVRVATQPLGGLSAGDLGMLVDMTRTQDVLLFASDYPHIEADTFDDVLGDVPAELQAKIAWENAVATYPRLQHLADRIGRDHVAEHHG